MSETILMNTHCTLQPEDIRKVFVVGYENGFIPDIANYHI